MNDSHFAHKIRQQLNRNLHELRPDTLSRLAAARDLALSRQKQTVASSPLAAIGGYFNTHFQRFSAKQLVAALLLFGCAISSTFWFADQRIQELSALDSALLSDDLPIGAFTDKGFSAWLKQSAEQ